MNDPKPSSLTSIAFNTGVTLERERIIKLLEEEFWYVERASKKPHKEPYVLGWKDAIALIRGEQE